MQVIPLINLTYILLPAALVVILMWHFSEEGPTTIYALARMTAQLCLVGYALVFIFETNESAVVLGVLSIMLLVSAWIALRPISKNRYSLLLISLSSILLVNGLLLYLITQWVLVTDPWHSPKIIIPLAGMIFATGMNSISLFVERYLSELKNQSQNESQDQKIAFRKAYSATMIPTINSLFAVGLVALPGMMTGQILSGVSPLIASRYQIMVMLMLFVSSGLTPFVFYRLLRLKDNISNQL